MLDPVTFTRLVPNNDHVPKRILGAVKPENLTEEHKMIFNSVMYGFSFGDKMWGAFAVSSLEGMKWDKGIIDSLVLPESQKDFVRALVLNHGGTGNGGRFDDFVRDKGKGLIGLLAGPPGVGKTLTAEAVAELAESPLYMLSSGELGETASSVQDKLKIILELTETWNAVLLLDEADVFLAKRDDNNLSRNAITSIFLRLLEYYQGILLLTTNRLKSFDPAFQSRIHFCFEYGDLEPGVREQIWRNFLEKVRVTGAPAVSVDDDELRGLAELDLNGRQIKNITSISQAVAIEKKGPLTAEIIRTAEKFARSYFS